MKQKLKITALIAATIMALSSASAELALTVPKSSQEIEGLETSYRIGLINTGKEKRNISFTADAPKALDISLPEKTILSSSTRSSTPEGENWYQAAPGRYVKIQYITLNVSIDPDLAEKRKFNFSVLASTTRKTSLPRPKVSSVNQLGFSLQTRSSEIETGFEGSLWEEPDTADKEREQTRNISQESTQDNTSDFDNSTQRPENNSASSLESEGRSGPTGVTIILLLGIVLSTGYVLSEVMI